MMKWKLSEMLACATIGVVFSVVYLLGDQVWLGLNALIGPMALDVMYGMWIIAAPIAAFIIRKPFAGAFAEIITGIVQLLLGSASGAMLIVLGVIQGLASEVPLMATGWKKYNLATAMLMGAFGCMASFVHSYFYYEYSNLNPNLVLAMFVVRTLSGVIIAGWLGFVIVNKLKDSKALKGFNLGK